MLAYKLYITRAVNHITANVVCEVTQSYDIGNAGLQHTTDAHLNTISVLYHFLSSSLSL